MSIKRLILALLLGIFVVNASAQNIQLTGPDPERGLHISLAPGKSPAGERLFQFNFHTFSKLKDSLRVDSLVLLAESGKQLILSKPGKLVNGRVEGRTRQWFSAFTLHEQDISFVKAEWLKEILLKINNEPVTILITDSARNQIRQVVAAHF